ncbi:Uncharacterized protein APZ42_000996, partial [Daphnia magna]
RKSKSTTDLSHVPKKDKQPRQDNTSIPISINAELNSNEDEVDSITTVMTSTTIIIKENSERTETTFQESTTDWGMELKKINFPKMWTYQQMGDQ